MAKKKVESIRLRIESDLLDRIDQVAGERGRQKFIHEAILGKLDEELPPVVYDLVRDVDDLKARVTFLESSRPIGMQMNELNDVTRNQLCRDETDRKLILYFIRNEGATTPELASKALGNEVSRRAVFDRISKLNERAEGLFGTPILENKKGIVKEKRGAWWITNIDLLIL